MSVKKILKNIIPNFILQKIKKRKEINGLIGLKKNICDTNNLFSSKEVNLENIFKNEEIISSWNTCQKSLNDLNIPDFTGGVNIGDRKAIFFLIRNFKPKSVLEIGTHIGASTVNIAAALKFNQTDCKIEPTFHTLDIKDVNSTSKKPWLDFGMNKSPLELIKNIDCDSFVRFITDMSINYLEKTTHKYDFIFLDGDHSSQTVYQELPLALSKLNKGGIILLHDYYPNGKLIWNNNYIIYGPYLAIERYINEGVDIDIIPLGALPWETKLNSNITSLALCLKK